ncbi:MAG: response regulator [Gammaproteobacteria bacterium]|nr:response regulator [Gammaproteobacteria bacterium]
MSKKILIIDDDEIIRRAFMLALEDTDYQVKTIDSGKKSVELVKHGKFDLIFLDLRMPYFDGIETISAIRKLDKTTPIYIITAFADEYNKELQTLVNNNIQFELINKPVVNEQIIMIAKSVLR